MSATSAGGCWSCGTPPMGRYCGTCGVELAAGGRTWQDSVYLEPRNAALYRRAPREIRALLPVLLEPFRHLDAIAPGRWRNVALIAAMGIAPLAFISYFESVKDAVDAFRVLGLYFSALWALFFASAFRATGIRWRLGLFAYFGTTFVAMTLLLLSLALNIELLRGPLVAAHNVWVAIPSAIAFIGIPEELTKALVLFAIWRFGGPLPALRAFLFYGLISGLGFGIKEGVHYQLGPYAAAASRSGEFAGFYLDSVLRLTSLPFFHAMWTGIAAWLIWFAARIPSARAGLLVLAVMIPATFHGLYDALVGRSQTLALVVVGLSIVLLGIYAASAAQFERWFGLEVDDDDGVVVPATTAEAGSAALR
ncbi:MAG: PrsW family intramembrane metalloprotease [Candidatus Eremiobacteraeota bacterium]|nr:PrsW family intramembrane metalloprotease [Candidatus Eremiobacteraeota bacterium]